jgi:hypothetical protein
MSCLFRLKTKGEDSTLWFWARAFQMHRLPFLFDADICLVQGHTDRQCFESTVTAKSFFFFWRPEIRDWMSGSFLVIEAQQCYQPSVR